MEGSCKILDDEETTLWNFAKAESDYGLYATLALGSPSQVLAEPPVAPGRRGRQ
jgi:hypothetical protein